MTDLARRNGEKNLLIVKVWSPWDDDVQDAHHAKRAFKVIRNMVKGTYEHDDALIARDVNPVGIYGDVELIVTDAVRITEQPSIHYELDDGKSSAAIAISAKVAGSGEAKVTATITDVTTGFVVARVTQEVELSAEPTSVRIEARVEGIVLWNTWDVGEPRLYDVELRAGEANTNIKFGFRTVEMVRNESQTTLILNGKRLYVRGTSYFPDVYLSTLTSERYRRDLHAIREAGFNLIRIHVHIQQPEFYTLCDELGLAVMQDSDYNWTHPEDEEWVKRLTSIYVDAMRMLDHHPSIVTWIGLNEPGFFGTLDHSGGKALTESPGPQMYEAITAADPTRPVIRGSFCNFDPLSGDTHNYRGSLEGNHEDYVEIDGTTEKLNTEFGFDAPGCEANLRSVPRVYKRLKSALPRLAAIQHYQARLIKYYIEHYRMQRWNPNSGYIQFMFIDLSPQSFYGAYDWWGHPKPVVDELLMSNQPVTVLVEQTAEEATGVLLINDSPRSFGTVAVTVAVRDEGRTLLEKTSEVDLGAREQVRVLDLELNKADSARIDVRLSAVSGSGEVIARNQYDDMFGHPRHVEGHPHRLSHDFGMRLYNA